MPDFTQLRLHRLHGLASMPGRWCRDSPRVSTPSGNPASASSSRALSGLYCICGRSVRVAEIAFRDGRNRPQGSRPDPCNFTMGSRSIALCYGTAPSARRPARHESCWSMSCGHLARTHGHDRCYQATSEMRSKPGLVLASARHVDLAAPGRPRSRSIGRNVAPALISWISGAPGK